METRRATRSACLDRRPKSPPVDGFWVFSVCGEPIALANARLY